MNSILINIDSKTSEYNNLSSSIFDCNINIDNLITYIKLKDINIPNEFNIYDTVFNNNYFIISCNLVGLPPGINVFNMPNIEIVITIPYYINTITKLLKLINTELYKNKFNNYENDIVDKGIYFDIIDNNVIIKNLSKHYNCLLNFNNDNINNISFGNYLGFKNDIYNIEFNNSIISEYAFNNYYDYIYIKINDYSNLYDNNNNPICFGKLAYNKTTNEYYNKIEFIHILKEHSKITNLHIEIVDINQNPLIFNSSFSFIIELGYNILYNTNDIFNILLLNNNILNEFFKNKNNILDIEKEVDILDIEKKDDILDNINNLDKVNNSDEVINSDKINDLDKVNTPDKVNNSDKVNNLDKVNKKNKKNKKNESYNETDYIIDNIVDKLDNIELDNNEINNNKLDIKNISNNNKLLFPFNNIPLLNSIKIQNKLKFKFDY